MLYRIHKKVFTQLAVTCSKLTMEALFHTCFTHCSSVSTVDFDLEK